MSRKKNNEMSFIKSVFTILTGTTFAQILPIIASPVLTRLYTPEEFGEFGLFIAILGVCAVIASLRYELAIALPKHDGNAVNILMVSIFISFLISSGLLIVVMIINNMSIFSNYNFTLANLIWMLPIAVFFTGMYQALINWNIRLKEFKGIAKTQFYRTTTIVSGQIGMGFILNSSFTLIISHVIGQIIAVFLLFKSSWKYLMKQKRSISFQNMKVQLLRYKNFPIYYSGAAILNTASVQLPLFMLMFFFNSSIVGFYTLANRILAAPISVVGTAIAQPYLQKATEEHRRGKLGEFSLKIFQLLLSIGFVPIILISIIAPELFNLIYGAEWIRAGIYVQLISVWLLLVFISSPLSHIYTVLELQKESLNFNVILFTSRILVLLVGGYADNDILTIALFGGTGAIILFFQIVWLLHKTGVKVTTVLKSILKEFINSIIFIITLLLTKLLFDNEIIYLIIFVLVFILFAFIKLKYAKFKL